MSRVIILHLTILIVLITSGCSAPPEWEETLKEEVFSGKNKISGSTTYFKKSQIQDFKENEVLIYIDRSLSMQPFLSGTTNTYKEIINSLLGTNNKAFGFGYVSSSDSSQQVDSFSNAEAIRSSSYSWANNDYASIIRNQFIADKNKKDKVFVIISDGVQSDTKNGVLFGEIHAAIEEWLGQGGIFQLNVFTSDYFGDYPSEVNKGSMINYSCNNRPFVAMIFSFSESSIQYLQEYFQPKPVYSYTIGRPLMSFSLLPALASEPPQANGLKLNNFNSMTIAGYNPIKAGKPNYPGDFKLSFALKAIHPLLRVGMLTNGNVIPSLDAWLVKDKRFSESRYVQIPITDGDFYFKDGYFNLKLKQDQIKNSFGNNADLNILFALSIRPKVILTEMIVPKKFSTLDDSTPNACGQVLNLSRMFSGVLRKNAYIDRTIFGLTLN